MFDAFNRRKGAPNPIDGMGRLHPRRPQQSGRRVRRGAGATPGREHDRRRLVGAAVAPAQRVEDLAPIVAMLGASAVITVRSGTTNAYSSSLTSVGWG